MTWRRGVAKTDHRSMTGARPRPERLEPLDLALPASPSSPPLCLALAGRREYLKSISPHFWRFCQAPVLACLPPFSAAMCAIRPQPMEITKGLWNHSGCMASSAGANYHAVPLSSAHLCLHLVASQPGESRVVGRFAPPLPLVNLIDYTPANARRRPRRRRAPMRRCLHRPPVRTPFVVWHASPLDPRFGAMRTQPDGQASKPA